MVVAGASSGVGRATARAFAERGDHVGLISREGDGIDAALAEARLLTTAVAAPADLADADAVEAAADRIERELGPIDVWVNVAMPSVFAPVREMRADEFRRVTEVTYLGYVYGTLAALRRMLRATRVRSCRWARRSATAASRCRPRTAAPSTPSRDSPSRCAASCSTTAAGCG